MTSGLPAPRARAAALAAAWLGGAAALGYLHARGAHAVHPLAVPALLAAVAVLVVSIPRPEIGAAVALVLPALASVGVVPERMPVLATLLALYLLVVVVVTGRAAGGLPALTVPAILYLLVAAASFAVSPASEGRQLLRALVGSVALFAVIALTVRATAQLRIILGAAAASALLVGGYAAYQFATGSGLEQGFVTASGALVARVSAGFAQPNQLGGYLAVLVPLAVAGVLLVRRGRLVFAAAAALGVFGVYASFSRSALVALVAIVPAFLGLRRTLLLAPVLLVFVALFSPEILAERFATLTTSGSELATRWDIWATAQAIWAEQPILGVGLGGFAEAYAGARVPGKEFLPTGAFEPPPHAHNVFLQLLAEQGLVGLLAFAAVIAGGLVLGLRLRRSTDRTVRLTAAAAVAAIAVFLIHNLFDVTLHQSETGVWLWAILGLVSALTAMERLSSTRAQAPPAVGR